MVTLIDNTNINLFRSSLEKFKQLYIEAFPVDNEREDFSAICARVESGLENCCPGSFILLDMNGEAVRGGAVYDWYSECCALELIYIVVDKSERNLGIGKSLFTGAMPMIQEYLGGKVNSVFFESEDPGKTALSRCPMSPVQRLRIYDRWGAKRVPIDYVQPPLSKQQGPAENLMLFCLPQGESATIQKTALSKFLTDFYAGLDAKDNDNLQRMKDQLSKLPDSINLEDIKEHPLFMFPDASVCFHFSMTPSVKDPGLKKDAFNIVFNSYECDLMNFRNQTERPIRTHHVKTIEGVTLSLSPFYSYSSEGYSFSRLSDRDSVKVKVSINYTWSAVAGEYMANIVIAPQESYFTEYDLIKLVSAFGSRQENVQFCQYVKLLDGKSFEEFLKEHLSGDFLEMNNGVSELELSQAMSFCGVRVPGESVVNNFSRQEPSAVCDADLEFCKALCGILLGIFDYGRMNAAEVRDTIRSFVLDEGHSFMVFSRGHLCKISYGSERERNENIYISPYILIASTVTAINERTLRKTSDLLKKDSIKQASNARYLLSECYLQDIFNYCSEIDILAAADSSLGMTSRKEQYLGRIHSIERRRDVRNEDFTMIADVVQGLLLGVLAVLQVYDPTDIQARIFSAALILLAIYFVFARRRGR